MDGMMNPLEGLKIFNGFPNDMLNGNGNGMGGGSWLVLLFLIILFGGNGMWGNRGVGGMNTTASIDESMILQGIQGTRTAIEQLASATNTSFDGVNRGLAQLSVALANNFGDVKAGIAQINSAIAAGNQQVISQIFNSINGLQTAMTQQNFDITTSLKDCCCNIREAISGVNTGILNQTNVLQNQLNQNAFAMERAFCNQNQLIREEGSATRASIEALAKQISQYRYDDLQNENCGLKAQLAQANTTNQLNTLQSNILTAITNKTTTTA